MNTIKIVKSRLLEILQKNRDAHFALFEKAFEGYRRESIRIHEENLRQLKSGKRVVVTFFEQAPQDHTKDYDLLIRMLEMSIGDTVELTQQEFQNYVDDDWNWKLGWTTSIAKYLS